MTRKGVIRLGLPGNVVELPVEFEGNGHVLTLIDTAGRSNTFEFRELPPDRGGEPGVLYLKGIFSYGPEVCRYCGRDLRPPQCPVCDNEE